MKVPSKDINFLPEYLVEKRMRRHRQRRFFPLLLLGLVFLGSLFYFPIFLTDWYKTEIERNQAEYRKLEAKYSCYEQLKTVKEVYAKNSRMVKSLEEQRVEMIKLIDGINSVKPPGINIKKIEVNPQSMYLKFETGNPIETVKFIIGLRQLGLFKQVELEEVPFEDGPHELELEMPFKT